MGNLKLRLEEGQCRVAELEEAILEEIEKENKDWMPELGERYYLIGNDKTIQHFDFSGDDCDKVSLEKRNCYKTKEEAQYALDMYEFCRERSLKPNWKNVGQRKYFIGLNYEAREVYVAFLFYCGVFSPFYYPTEKDIQDIADRYSFDELVKYYGRV